METKMNGSARVVAELNNWHNVDYVRALEVDRKNNELRINGTFDKELFAEISYMSEKWQPEFTKESKNTPRTWKELVKLE